MSQVRTVYSCRLICIVTPDQFSQAFVNEAARSCRNGILRFPSLGRGVPPPPHKKKLSSLNFDL